MSASVVITLAIGFVNGIKKLFDLTNRGKYSFLYMDEISIVVFFFEAAVGIFLFFSILYFCKYSLLLFVFVKCNN